MPPPGEMRDQLIESTAIIYDAENQTVQLFGDLFSLPELRAHLEDAGQKISNSISKIIAGWK
jgi:hypothetical protein